MTARLRSALTHPSWRHFRYALIVFAVWRVVTFGVSWLGSFTLPRPTSVPTQVFGPDSTLALWCRGDLASLVRPDSFAILLLAAHVAFLVGLWAAYRVALVKLDEADARLAPWFVVTFPTSFVFGAVDSASFYFLFATAALLFFERRAFAAAGVAACAALATMLGVRIANAAFGSPLPAIAEVDWSFSPRKAADMLVALRLACVVGAAVAAVLMRKRLGIAYSVATLVPLAVAIPSPALSAVGPMAASLFPLALFLATALRRASFGQASFDRWAIYASSLLAAVGTLYSTNVYW